MVRRRKGQRADQNREADHPPVDILILGGLGQNLNNIIAAAWVLP